MDYYKNLSLENIVSEIKGVIYTEEWKHIIGYEGVFMISTFGRFKSVCRKRKAQRGTTRIVEEKILTQKITKRGYLNIGLKFNCKRKWFNGHSITAIHFCDNPLSKKTVNHDDFIKTNNFYKNLEWMTQKENNEHAIRGGRNTVGVNNGRSILTESDVLSIRVRHNEGASIGELRKEYSNVGISALSHVIKGRHWKHL